MLRDGVDTTEYAIKTAKARMQGVECVSHEDTMRKFET